MRLTIYRNALPHVKLLWDADPDLRIAQLLEQISRDIPLENEHWGIQDYTAKLDDYECLHYQRVGDVFRKDDEVEYVQSTYLMKGH